MPEAEDLWREQGEHAHTAFYTMGTGLFQVSSGKDWERNFTWNFHRLWKDVTNTDYETLCVCVFFFFLRVSIWRAGSPRFGATALDPYRNSSKKRSEAHQRGSHTSVNGWDTVALLTKIQRQRIYWRNENLAEHGLWMEGSTEWRIWAELPVRERQAQVWKAGAECLRCAAAIQSLKQRGKPNPHLWHYRLHRVVKSGSWVSCYVDFLRGKEKKCL